MMHKTMFNGAKGNGAGLATNVAMQFLKNCCVQRIMKRLMKHI